MLWKDYLQIGVKYFQPQYVNDPLRSGLPHILANKIPGLFQDFSRTICQISRTLVFEKLNECSCLREECMFDSLPYTCISNTWLMCYARRIEVNSLEIR